MASKACFAVVLACVLSTASGQDPALPSPSLTEVWEPVPPKVDAPAGGVPSDAKVLFAGTDTGAWEKAKGGGPIGWNVVDGALVVTPGSGDIRTREAFGDVQLHIEFRTQTKPKGDGQGASNSGVFLMERYELQVLDSYRNKTYVNGQAASVYKQYPPLVNASRPPGEWQSYDVLFLAPRFAADGRVQAPARMTVFHNGVLVQDHVTLSGPSGHYARPPYEAHPEKLPIGLQDHAHPVRFRNIWIRELKD